MAKCWSICAVRICVFALANMNRCVIGDTEVFVDIYENIICICSSCTHNICYRMNVVATISVFSIVRAQNIIAINSAKAERITRTHTQNGENVYEMCMYL